MKNYTDRRYAVSREFIGCCKAKWVVRFEGEYVQPFKTRIDAYIFRKQLIASKWHLSGKGQERELAKMETMHGLYRACAIDGKLWLIKGESAAVMEGNAIVSFLEALTTHGEMRTVATYFRAAETGRCEWLPY